MTILSNGHQWKFSEFLDNKNYSFNKKNILSSLSDKEIDDAYSSISKWEGYAPTPLVSLNKLSKELNLNNIYYKDESKRFDLKSFKALGGAYAVEKVTQGNKDIVVATATAGNHGRSVAWGARRLGLKCKIFKLAIDSILSGIKIDLSEFGIEYQQWFSEQSLVDSGLSEKTVKALQKSGHIYEKEGALWFKTTDFGDDLDRVVVRDNGMHTYFASDIA